MTYDFYFGKNHTSIFIHFRQNGSATNGNMHK